MFFFSFLPHSHWFSFCSLCLFQFLFRHLFIVRIVYSDNLQLTGLSLNGIKLELHIVRVQTISRSLCLKRQAGTDSEREIDRETLSMRGGKVKKATRMYNTRNAASSVFLLILYTPWRIPCKYVLHSVVYGSKYVY